ncbi:EamA family transporter [Castellaniella sp.]|uniref:EamA family transporter n=1 Tax=Castellaniella sp. TaxID=1955812 RepID=UPI003C756849
MADSGATRLFPQHVAIGLLLLIGTLSALNHVAARIAFDDGAGVMLAVICRAAFSGLALLAVVLWQGHSLRLPGNCGPWQLLLGLMVALQSLCLYSAVARIPVALALLLGSLFPILLALLTWALGGARPTRRAGILMACILLGLVFVLDLPGVLSAHGRMGSEWTIGVLFAFCSASFFTVGLWISDHRLSHLIGPVRSLYTIAIVFGSMLAVGVADFVPGGLNMPLTSTGWLGLGVLSVLYATTFSILFITIPRLDMPRNAPVMNSEPVASLLFGWLVLNQTFNELQLLGGAIVLGCIVLLAYSRN